MMHRNPSFNPNEQDASRMVAGSTAIPTPLNVTTDTEISPSVLKFELPVSPPNDGHDQLKSFAPAEQSVDTSPLSTSLVEES